jgi:predicted nuclease of predicted toxin-antitoxin system
VKILLDTCVWGKAREELTDEGNDVIWAGDWPEDPGDEEILDRAVAENRIRVTLDKDFGELAIVDGKRHCGIVRLVGISARQQAAVCVHVLGKYGDELAAGALVAAEHHRVRVCSAEEKH